MKPSAEGSNGDPREIRLSAAVTQHAAAFLLAGPPLVSRDRLVTWHRVNYDHAPK